MSLKLVHDAPPNFVECLGAALKDAKAGQLTGLGVFYIKDGDIHTEFVKREGVSMAELLGAAEVLRATVLDNM